MRDLPSDFRAVYRATSSHAEKELPVRGRTGQFVLVFSDGSTLGFHPPMETSLGDVPWRMVLEQRGVAWELFKPFSNKFEGGVLMSGGHTGHHTYGYTSKMASNKSRQGEQTMSNLFQAVQRIASQHPETRQHLVPLLRKYADTNVVACTCPAGIGHNAADYDVMADGDELMAREWGKAIHRDIHDDQKPVIGDPTGTRGNPSGKYGPYKKHEKSPPAGADGSPQRKKYNDWYRKNVCPEKDGCGAPWLKG